MRIAALLLTVSSACASSPAADAPATEPLETPATIPPPPARASASTSAAPAVHPPEQPRHVDHASPGASLACKTDEECACTSGYRPILVRDLGGASSPGDCIERCREGVCTAAQGPM